MIFSSGTRLSPKALYGLGLGEIMYIRPVLGSELKERLGQDGFADTDLYYETHHADGETVGISSTLKDARAVAYKRKMEVWLLH